MWSTTSPTRQRNDEESAEAAATDSSSDAYPPEKPQQQQPLPDDDDPDPPPDGGRQAWTQVLCMHLVFLNTWGVSNGYGVFQRYYLSRFPSSSPSAVSWVGSIQVFLVFFVGVLAGLLFKSGAVPAHFWVPDVTDGAPAPVAARPMMALWRRERS